MSVFKSIERANKQFLIRVITTLVRTRKVAPAEILRGPLRKILVIRQHNQMGDMLLATPAFRAIKLAHPEAALSVLTARINRAVLDNSPHVSGLHTYTRNPISLIRMIIGMRRAGYDLVIVLHTVSFSFTSALLGLVSGARFRTGSTSTPFGTALSRSFYHLELPLPTDGELKGMNEAEHNLYPLRALGIESDDLAPLLVPDTVSESWADRFVDERTLRDRPSIVVHPGAGKTENIWPPENLAGVMSRLCEMVPMNLIVVEGPRDGESVKRFQRALGVPITIVRGRRIGDVGALMQRADLVVCNDTGVMHVSCAVGARTLAVFGPTDPVRWAPKARGLTIVRARNGDLTALDIGTVYEAALNILQS